MCRPTKRNRAANRQMLLPRSRGILALEKVVSISTTRPQLRILRRPRTWLFQQIQHVLPNLTPVPGNSSLRHLILE